MNYSHMKRIGCEGKQRKTMLRTFTSIIVFSSLLFCIPPTFSAQVGFTPQSTVLEGHVLNATSYAPVPQARVHIEPGNFTTETDSNGSFSVSLPAGGNYTVNVTADGYLSHEETVSCELNQTLHIDILLFPLGTSFENGTIFGFVLDGMLGTPISGAIVSFSPENITATTNETGYFSVSAKGSTYYTITANASGYFDASTFVFLEPNGSLNVTFYMTPIKERIGYIFGYVFDATNGARIANAEIHTVPSNITTYSDDQGYYNITVAGNLDYTLYATAEGYQSGSKSVYVGYGETVRVDIALTPIAQTICRIEGFVYDNHTHEPLASAIIVAIPGNLSAVSNNSGYYYLELLPGINYTVKCQKEGYIENHTYCMLSQNETKTVDFYLRPEYENGKVHGKVYDAISQIPLASALVVIEPEGVSSITDENGSFAFLLRTGWSYKLTASCENYTSHTLTFTLNETDLQIDIYLYPRIYNLTINITGVVKNAAGKPVENAEVELRALNSTLLLINYTDANGIFIFKDLPVLLNYTITITAPGYEKAILTLKNEEFSGDTYVVPEKLTKLKELGSENQDYTPLVIGGVLIACVSVAFVSMYILLRKHA
ncbi:MAG: carboxypeptidase regulatory-like domain-containing protein [Thermoplasmata archaeon]